MLHSRHVASAYVALSRVMLVGWGGNNGTTVTAGVLANKLCAPQACAVTVMQAQDAPS